MFKLHEDWKGIATKSWQMRFIYLSSAITAVQMVIQYAPPDFDTHWLVKALFVLNVMSGFAGILKKAQDESAHG